MNKGCRIYAFEAINKDYNPSTKLPPILFEFEDVFVLDFLGLHPVIAQVVGWEKPDPIMEQVLQLWESYTQCHLDVGPTLQGD